MKKIEAIIRPEKLEELRDALEKKGYIGMTVTEVRGRGKQKGVKLEWRVGEYQVEFLPKVKVEMVMETEGVDGAIAVIEEVCSTGNIGDGKIFISTIDQVVRLRTKEKGVEAI